MIRDTSTMDRPVDRPRGLSQRRLALGVAVLLVLGLLLVLLPSVLRWARSETSVDMARIRIGAVTRGDLVRDVAVQGNVVAAFHPTLFSPARGIAELFVKAGETVEAGRILARVESPELESRLLQERSTLLSLESELERQRILAKQHSIQSEEDLGLLEVELDSARRAMERAERSRREGILNDVEYEEAQDAVRVATLKLELARRRAEFEAESLELETRNRRSLVERQRLILADVERQVEELTVRSPVDGLVSRLEIEDRDAVALGSPIVSVVDLSEFELEVMVPESYADEIGPRTEAIVAYGGRDWAGRVKSISPEVEGSRVRALVEFVGTAPEGLKQNQRLSTQLVLETRENVLKVPRGPFLEAGGGRHAYVVEDGVAVLRPIEVGGLSVSEVEIASGLEAGDRIILSDTTRFDGAETVLLRN